MKSLLIILALMTTCCAKKEHTLEIQGFETQVRAFEAAYGLKIDDLIIRKADLRNDDEAGVCYANISTPVIDIDENYWSNATDTQKEILIFHELGHCVLFRPNHNNAVDSEGMPVSIMNYCMCNFSSVESLQYYEDNRSNYLLELIQNH